MSQRSIWDRIAPRYDRAIRWFDARYDLVRERLGRDLAGRDHVLELGAGTGQFTNVLAAAAGRVTATDLSPQMIAGLASRLERDDLTNVEAQVMDAGSIDAADGAFDGVVCANLLHIVPEPARVLAEAARVLKPDGLLIAPTFCYAQSRRARLALVCLRAISPFRVHGRFSAESLAELVATSGFRVERCEDLGGWLPEVYLTAQPPAALTSRRSARGSVRPASS